MEDSFIPDFAQIAQSTGLSADALSFDTVTIHTSLFKHLIAQQLRHLPFDDGAYRAANPDVDAAFARGEVSSLFSHYVGTGYFEGRSPGWHYVDVDWYRSHYVDLAVAHRSGRLNDLSAHFQHTGRAEGRSGSAKQLEDRRDWDRAIGVLDNT